MGKNFSLGHPNGFIILFKRYLVLYISIMALLKKNELIVAVDLPCFVHFFPIFHAQNDIHFRLGCSLRGL